jgi:hypothetical protein
MKFNPLRIFIEKANCGVPEWLFTVRRIDLINQPLDTTVYLCGPIRNRYTVIVWKDLKCIKWSTPDFETAWRAAWRRLWR